MSNDEQHDKKIKKTSIFYLLLILEFIEIPK